MSLPTRERGLKHVMDDSMDEYGMSLPTRERGLKLLTQHPQNLRQRVAPYAGAWIETRKLRLVNYILICRSLRGSVD